MRRLAARAGASVSVHAPLGLVHGGFANKLRGLEAPGQSSHRLLLDADMLVLGPLAGIMGAPPAADFAAAPAGKPQISAACWEEIYAGLGLPVPTTRMACLRAELGLGMDRVHRRYPFQEPEAAAMLPYHNSGALRARRGTALRAVWEEHLGWIGEHFRGRPDAPAALTGGDQVGLATALHALAVREGRTFRRLPDEFNVRAPHWQAGARRRRDVRLFHATSLFSGLSHRAGLPAAMDEFTLRWVAGLREGFGGRPLVFRWEAWRAGRFLPRLWRRWVRRAWQDG